MEMFDQNLDFEFEGLGRKPGLSGAMARISVSGVQEKFPALIENGRLRIADASERSTHILKPAPWDETLDNRKFLPANEYLTMQIASEVYGIETAENTLCFTSRHKGPVYVTRRFDLRQDGGKYLMEDFASIMNLSNPNDKYTGCYLDVANALRRYVPAWMVDMERLFTLIVFNYIYCNGDAHLKNFSLITKDSERRLCPAYDLLNTALHVKGDAFALEGGLGEGFEKYPNRKDFEEFGRLIGLKSKRVENILDKFVIFPQRAAELLNRSFLPDKLRRIYRREVEERIRLFNRQ